MPEAPDPLEAHYRAVLKAIIDGRVVPLLGAGVNLCGRPRGMAWQPRQGVYLPSSGELSAYLAENFDYPASDTNDLVRVSQYIAVITGSGPLYEKLHSLLDADFPPTPLHQFFAALPAALRAKGYPARYQLLVTTNYDDLMERAFKAANELRPGVLCV